MQQFGSFAVIGPTMSSSIFFRSDREKRVQWHPPYSRRDYRLFDTDCRVSTVAHVTLPPTRKYQA